MSFVPYTKDSDSIDEVEGQGEFIFILDRSGSMSGSRIDIAKQATILFLKSLPENSYFNIISFGSYFERMFPKSVKSDSFNINYAVAAVNLFKNDMLGTEIYEPLQSIYNDPLIEGYSKTLFLITDGEVENPCSVIQLVALNSGVSRVHSFGIGTSFDQYLIKIVAKAGKGFSNFVSDVNEIGSKVISSLKKSIMPSVSEFYMKLYGEFYPRLENFSEIYYGERYIQYFMTELIPNDSILFSYFDYYMRSYKSVDIGKPQEIKGDYIYKLYTKLKIADLCKFKNENKDKIISLSVKSGIPCELTSFIIVNENKDIIQEELERINIRMEDGCEMPRTKPHFYSIPQPIQNRMIRSYPYPIVSAANNPTNLSQPYINLNLNSQPYLHSQNYPYLSNNRRFFNTNMPIAYDRSRINSNFVGSHTINSPPSINYPEKDSQGLFYFISSKPLMHAKKLYFAGGGSGINVPTCDDDAGDNTFGNIGTGNSITDFNAIDQVLSNTSINVPKNLDYMTIISNQTTYGVWQNAYFVSILPKLNDIPYDIIDCQEKPDAFCTILILLILEKDFMEKKDEWVLVKKKAVKWLKSVGADFEKNKEKFLEFI